MEESPTASNFFTKIVDCDREFCSVGKTVDHCKEITLSFYSSFNRSGCENMCLCDVQSRNTVLIFVKILVSSDVLDNLENFDLLC